MDGLVSNHYQLPVFKQSLKARLELQLDLKKLFSAIDRDPALVGAGVVYIDAHGTMVTLREFTPLCFIKPVKVILKEPYLPMSSREFLADLKTNKRDSKMTEELLGLGLSCGAAVLGWVAVVTSTAAIPVTSGVSAAGTVLLYSASVAGTLQCANSVARVAGERFAPETLDAFDDQQWYQLTSQALDAVALGGAALSGALTVKLVFKLRRQQIPMKEVLYGRLDRAQRKRLTDEIIELNHPGISAKLRKHAQRNGIYPKRYNNTEIANTAVRQIQESVAATLTFAGSATSGVVSQLAIGIFRETD